MEKRIRFILIALASLSLVSLFVSFKLYRDKGLFWQQYILMEQNLRQENETLTKKLVSLQEEKRKLQENLGGFNKEFEKISRERVELKKMYESLLKEKKEISEKLKVLEQQRGAPSGLVGAPVVEDTYWANILKAKADLEIRLNSAKDKLRDIAIKAEELSEDKSNLELELSKLKQFNADLERRVSYAGKLSETLSLELVREKNDKRTLQEHLKMIKEENVAMRDQLKEVRNVKVALEKKLDKTLEEKTQLGQHLVEMEETLKDRMSEIAGIKKEMEIAQSPQEIIEEKTERTKEDVVGSESKETKAVELSPIVVRPEGEAALGTLTTSSVSGKIIAVNKENNFVIIDLGEDVGVRPGRKFSVYREDQKIATIEVIQTRKNISAADIRQLIRHINVGDVVK